MAMNWTFNFPRDIEMRVKGYDVIKIHEDEIRRVPVISLEKNDKRNVKELGEVRFTLNTYGDYDDGYYDIDEYYEELVAHVEIFKKDRYDDVMNPYWDLLRYRIYKFVNEPEITPYFVIQAIVFPEYKVNDTVICAETRYPINVCAEDAMHERYYYAAVKTTTSDRKGDIVALGVSSASADSFYAEIIDYEGEITDAAVSNGLKFANKGAFVKDKTDDYGFRHIKMKDTKAKVAKRLVNWLTTTSKPTAIWKFIGDNCELDKLVIDELLASTVGIPERLLPIWDDVTRTIEKYEGCTAIDACKFNRKDFISNTYCDKCISEIDMGNAFDKAIVTQAIHEVYAIKRI